MGTSFGLNFKPILHLFWSNIGQIQIFWESIHALWGKSLHRRFHGEAFLTVFSSWMQPGIILMDEPEAALSPQRKLTLLVQMAKLAHQGGVQFIIATHSPIILKFPGSTILSFDGGRQLKLVSLQDTAHYQITRGILESPDRFWNHLLRSSDDLG